MIYCFCIGVVMCSLLTRARARAGRLVVRRGGRWGF